MRCPDCSGPDTRVLDSRHSADTTIRRRRECESCGCRFTTYEQARPAPHLDDHREPARAGASV
jgi:transcriptional repressor NrdR